MNKDTRIAVIGSGPAGTSAAYYLHKNGFENVTIFEKEKNRWKVQHIPIRRKIL